MPLRFYSPNTISSSHLPQGITVLGGGSWATAIVKILSENVSQLNWWIRKRETIDYIKKHKRNPNYLTDVVIDTGKVILFDDMAAAIEKSSAVILAIPSAFLKTSLQYITPHQLRNKIVFSAIKGIVPEDLLIVGDFLQTKYNVHPTNVGVITGPCHAEEVAMEKLSYLTIACPNIENAQHLSHMMNCRYIKTNVSDDIYGTEYAAVLKNVIAIASGMCHSLGYGDNFNAVLISNALREIKRFVDKVHPIERDIKESAYLGDLLVTAYSQFSRNRTFGSMIGKGYSIKAAQMEMNMIAEGYYAVKCVNELNRKLNVDMPICDAVYNVLYQSKSAKSEIKALETKLS